MYDAGARQLVLSRGYPLPEEELGRKISWQKNEWQSSIAHSTHAIAAQLASRFHSHSRGQRLWKLAPLHRVVRQVSVVGSYSYSASRYSYSYSLPGHPGRSLNQASRHRHNSFQICFASDIRIVVNRNSINVESFVVENRFSHHRPFEYEYRDTEYEYDCPDERSFREWARRVFKPSFPRREAGRGRLFVWRFFLVSKPALNRHKAGLGRTQAGRKRHLQLRSNNMISASLTARIVSKVSSEKAAPSLVSSSASLTMTLPRRT